MRTSDFGKILMVASVVFLIGSCSDDGTPPGPVPGDPGDKIDCETITFSGFMKPLIEKSCAIPDCHVEGTNIAPFPNYTAIATYAQGIKERTANRNMPLQGTLTNDEIDMIVCWVDGGVPNN